jgi:hypothetical protein
MTPLHVMIRRLQRLPAKHRIAFLQIDAEG